MAPFFAIMLGTAALLIVIGVIGVTAEFWYRASDGAWWGYFCTVGCLGLIVATIAQICATIPA